jgi:hypothetical protein
MNYPGYFQRHLFKHRPSSAGPEKSGRAMKMTHVRWSLVVPVLVMVGWLLLYVMIFIEIGFP